MMPIPSPHYTKSVQLLKELARLMADGKGDDAEADAVRDQMDEPWYQMSEQEQRRVGDLSADLYTLTDPPTEAPTARPEVYAALQDAISVEDWPRILELLREEPGLESHSRRAYLRGLAWTALGDVDTGERFMEQAQRANG